MSWAAWVVLGCWLGLGILVWRLIRWYVDRGWRYDV